MTKRLRKIPVGWRVVAPWEKVKEGDYMAPLEWNYYEAKWAQLAFKSGNPPLGWTECDSSFYFNKGRNEGYNKGWRFIRRKTPKNQQESVALTSPNNTIVGTVAANSTTASVE